MNDSISKASRIGVPAISFAQVPELVELLLCQYPNSKINLECAPRYETEASTIDYLRDCDAAIVSFEPISDHVLNELPNLKVVSNLGVGVENIDPAAMRRHNVRLGWKSGVNKRSVAELTLCLAIAGLRHVVASNVAIRAGERPLQCVGRQLTGRTVGVHGCGDIGKEFIKLLQPFRCKILACDIEDRSDFYDKYAVQAVTVDELYSRSEVLSIHLNVTNATRGMYSSQTLDRLRPDCVLINTSRGTIVDEVALRKRLKNGSLAAAAFDVFAVEPPNDDELLNLRNFIATPHLGAGSFEARMRMGKAAIEGLTDNFLPQPGCYPFGTPSCANEQNI